MIDINIAKKNLIAYSDEMVEKKHVLKQITHSNSTFISNIRRGVQSGETTSSKIAGVSRKLLPNLVNQETKDGLKHIPVAGASVLFTGIMTSISNDIYNEINNIYRKKNLASAYAREDDQDIAKFEIKSFSMKNIDSYRQKLDEAVKNYNAVMKKSDASFIHEAQNNSICNYHVDICMASAQLARRLNKMIEAYSQIDAIGEVLRKRIYSIYKEFHKGESSYWDKFQSQMPDCDASHLKCRECFRTPSPHKIPLNARLASKISSYKSFSSIVKKNIDSSINSSESLFIDDVIKNNKKY